MKRLTLLLALLALLAGCAPAAPGPTSTPVAAVTLRFAANGLEQARYQPIIDAFQRQNSDVRVEFVPFASIPGASSASPEEQTGQIVRAADTAAVLVVNQVDVAQGLLRDLAPFIEADPSFAADDFYAGALEKAPTTGGVAMLPAALRVPLLFYNRERLGLAGAAPSPTWSASDMLDLAERLASRRSGAIEHYGLIDQNGWTALGVALTAAGLDLTQDGTAVRLDTPAARQALERVAGWVRDGAVLIPAVSAGGTWSQNQAEEQLRAGRVGLWSSSYGLNPRTATELNQPFQVGVLAVPTAPNTPIAHAAGGFVMSSGTPHPEAAWRWLSFLSRQYSPPAAADGLSLLPARRSLAESSGYWGRLDAEASEAVRASLERIATPTRRGYNWQLLAALAPTLNAVVNQNQPLEAALSQAQADYEQRLAASQAAAAAPAVATTAPVALATATPQAAPGVTTIRFTSLGNNDRFQAMAEIFNRQNTGVQVTIIDIPGTITSEDVANQSDCFMSFFVLDAPSLQAITLDLQPLIDADASFNQQDYPAALLTPFRLNGALHGLPFEVTFRLLRYNPALFDAAGLDYPQPNWTMDDLLRTAQALTSGSDNNRQYGLVAPEVRHISYVLDQFGASPTLGSGQDIRPNFTDPGVARALRYYLELLRAASPHTKLNNYRYLPQGRGSDWEALNSVWQGRTAMWLDNGELRNYFPMGVYKPPLVGAIAPPPLGQRPLTTNDFVSSGLYISARTQHAAACWQWLKFLSSQPEALDGETFPARRSVADSEAFRARMAPGAAEVYRAYTPLLNNGSLAAQPAHRLNAYATKLDGFWFYQAVERALQGGDLEKELADAQFKTEQFLACYRGGEGWRVCARQVDPQYQGFALMFEKE